ncbi:MAG: cation-transporting P-type ATPase [Burkholderiales bacterium]|nr:cation-transporting P-type ATPase [Burkholderiales bacterium]
MDIVSLPIADVLTSLKTSPEGLAAPEAARRLAEFGPNRIEAVRGRPLWLRFLGEFAHFFAVILWVAAALAFFAETRNPGEGMGELAAAIVAVIVVNGAFSFWQEYRAERALAALRRLLPPQARALRDASLQETPADELVPGDILLFEEGDSVPADCRLVEAAGLRVNLSTLTGEALPKSRTAEGIVDGNALEARNLLLAGTSILSGHCRAVVYATGMRTEFGRVAHLTQSAGEEASPLKREITRLTRLLAAFAGLLGLAFFAIGTAIGLPFWDNAMFAIGIIVANVPEGLLPTVTLSLAMATQRMARRNALVRHLPAVETLGAATVICCDKTGTLTQNRMSARAVHLPRLAAPSTDLALAAGEAHLLRNARLCHSLRRGRRNGAEGWLGDPMEAALVAFAGDGEGDGDGAFEREPADELAFDSERRRMSVVVRRDGERWLYCKGAPEVVLPLCDRIEEQGATRALDEAARRAITAAQLAMAEGGLRVLGFACRPLAPGERPEERCLAFSGLVGLHDPPRPEVPEAVARCRTAGIKVIMVTGDHPHTALAIARDVGLVATASPVVVQGAALRKTTPAELQIALDAPEILFTRVTAEQKMRVVEALKAKGHVVAVTGDGVNDAPALRTAHIGIAMGLSGTDVAKEAADVVLLDDNFASIVNAIEEGRAVFDNIRKFLAYILTSNIPELVPYLAHVLARIPLPLTVIQILAVDLGTDMLPALALGAERPHREVMRRPPRPAGERLLNGPLLARAYLWLGMLQAAAAMAAFLLVLRASGWQWGEMPARLDPAYLEATTACLAAIVVAQVVNVFLCRHPQEPALPFRYGDNPLLVAGIAFEVALILAIVYTPAGNALFRTRPLGVGAWLAMIALALDIGLLEELRKLVARSRRRVSPGDGSPA